MKFIAVTNRSLCHDDKDFFTRIEFLCDVLRKGDKILLREPNLEVPEYTALAEECRDICHDTPIHLLLHTHFETAKALHLKQVHLPMALLRVGIPIGYRCSASVHSVEEAIEAQKLGAEFLIAGHIYATDCKKGLPPRGVDFLKAVCDSVDIPVYAIGGITPEKVPELKAAGATGICVMSALMTCDDPVDVVRQFQSFL